MDIVKRSGEVVARQINRRRFLEKSALTMFGAVAALAVDFPRLPTAEANDTCAHYSSSYSCGPLNGKYCSPSYCQGAACNTSYCTYNTGSWPDGCWCTLTGDYNCGTSHSYSGYYKCCDCNCPGGGCSCRNFNYTCKDCVGSPANCIPCC